MQLGVLVDRRIDANEKPSLLKVSQMGLQIETDGARLGEVMGSIYPWVTQYTNLTRVA